MIEQTGPKLPKLYSAVVIRSINFSVHNTSNLTPVPRHRDQVEMAEKPARPPIPEETSAETEQSDTQQPQQISRLNSLSERVTKVTGNTKKFIMSQKTVTPATKKTLDGVLIDGRLTEPTGLEISFICSVMYSFICSVGNHSRTACTYTHVAPTEFLMANARG